MSIADHLAEGRMDAVKNGICPHFAMLGPVKYKAWRRWVKTEVGSGPPKYADEHETFYGMIIVPSEQPGIVISSTKCTP